MYTISTLVVLLLSVLLSTLANSMEYPAKTGQNTSTPHADLLILLDNTRSMSLPILTPASHKPASSSKPVTRLQALKKGVANWLNTQNDLQIGLMQYNTPGAAIIEPIRDVNTPSDSVTIWDENTLLEHPSQRVTGTITVLTDASAPTFRQWDHTPTVGRSAAQWHRIQQYSDANRNILKHLGLENNTGSFTLTSQQITLIPFAETRLPTQSQIKNLYMEWVAVRDVPHPIQLSLALIPYSPWVNTPNLKIVFEQAHAANHIISWQIEPQKKGQRFKSPSLLPLLDKQPVSLKHESTVPTAQTPTTHSSTTQWAVLIKTDALKNTLILKSTRQEDETDEPLLLKIISRHFQQFTAPSLRFTFNHLPIPAGITPKTASIHVPNWPIPNTPNNETNYPNRLPLTGARWYLPKNPSSLTSTDHTHNRNTNPIIDIFDTALPWSAPQNLTHQTSSTFDSGSLVEPLSLRVSHAPANADSEHQTYQTFDPFNIYFALPDKLTPTDMQTLYRTLNGATATLAIHNDDRPSKRTPHTYASNQKTQLFQFRPNQLTDTEAPEFPKKGPIALDTDGLILTFNHIPLKPSITPVTARNSDSSNSDSSKPAPGNNANDQKFHTTRVWLEIPRTSSFTNEPTAYTFDLSLNISTSRGLTFPEKTDSPHKRNAQQKIIPISNIYSFTQQHSKTLSLELTPLLKHLLTPDTWHADGSWHIEMHLTPADKHNILNWQQAKLMIRAHPEATDTALIFTAKQQLQHTVETLKATMRGSVTDALLEASLFYAGQPPFFGSTRQRFPLIAGNADPWDNRLSHPSIVTNAKHLLPPGCSAIQLDNPACASEKFVGNARYDNLGQLCRPQHLVIISDGVAPLNHSQTIAGTLTKNPVCYRDSVARSEQCGRTLAQWLQKGNDEKNQTQRLQVTIHSIAFNTHDVPSRHYLYALAEAGKGVYREANSPEELTNALEIIGQAAIKAAATDKQAHPLTEPNRCIN